MFYFAYGSNLNHKQMRIRCKDSHYIKKIILKNYRLVFRSKYGVADIEKKIGEQVHGALYNISKLDEKKLDVYEEFPTLYEKMFFSYNNREVMSYIMKKKTKKVPPKTRYLNTIKEGYKDCKINISILKKALLPFSNILLK